VDRILASYLAEDNLKKGELDEGVISLL